MKRLLLTSLCLLFAASAVQAVPTDVWYEDGRQDPLWVPPLVHELGNQPPFPDREWIRSSDIETTYTPCPLNWEDGNPPRPNIEVTITNMTGRNWSDLWYVADPETALTNDDGWINGELAFKIDNIGLNKPLVYEDNWNGIFEAGETWRFVIQNYANALGLAASDFRSIGVPSASPPSSGSIIAIPEPATIGLLGLGALSLLRRKRR